MKSDFKRVKWWLLWQMVLALLISIAIGFLIMTVLVDGVLQEPFARAFVTFFRRFLSLDEENAIYLYAVMIRGNKWIIVIVGFCLLYTVVVVILFSRISRLFDEIEDKTAEILLQPDDRIVFSRMLEPLEDQFNDVKTTLKKRAYEAKMSEQQKNDLIVYLAHDLKTPLTSVIGYLSLLNEAPDMPPAQKAKYTGVALNKAYRLEELIDEFFEITRFNLQNIVINEEQVDVSMMLEQLVEEFYPILVEKQLEMQLSAGEHITVMGDRDKLARVMDNLLRNAVYYSTQNTVIRLEAKDLGTKIQFLVDNEGKDIPPHKLERLFEKFYRMDESRRQDTGGAGLGLAIAKEIVERHNGRITVKSEGGHTVFTVLIPKHLS